MLVTIIYQKEKELTLSHYTTPSPKMQDNIANSVRMVIMQILHQKAT